MDNSSDEDDVCEATTKPNAFDVLMAPLCKKAKVDGVVDPIVIAVIYIRWLKWIDPSAPLYGCPYGGQAVRVGNSAEEVAAARWKQENQQALREDKRVGLIHELKVHGATAFHNEIVDWRRGPRSEVQQWADEREIALIAAHGGPLRDPSTRCKQTLNLTKGGKQGCSFEAIDASRTVLWLHFQDEMEEYIECFGTSLVPYSYVNSVSGHKLGQHLGHVRQGKLWRGHPDETKRVEWLESLPGWAWNSRETDEWRDAQSERTKAMWSNADEETLAEWCRKNSEAHNRPEVKAAASERAKKQFESQEARNALSERGKKRFESQEARDAQSERAKKQFESQEARNALSERAKTQAVREAAEGKTSLAERGKATRIGSWTKEQHDAAKIKRAATIANHTQEKRDAISAKKTATTAAKRAAVLAALPESERPKKQAEFDRRDLQEAKRSGNANALLKLPSYAEKGYQWCYSNFTQATNDGVVFFQNEHGVWCARMGNQGECAGSSAEHARTVALEATVAA
jgi:hypothetical protein